MKTMISFLIFFYFSGAKSYDYKKIMSQYDYMSVSSALEKWKIKKVDLKKISTTADYKKLISEKEKTQYLIYLADKKNFIGQNRNLIIDALGEPESYFFSEQNATYDLLKTDADQWVVSFEVSSDQIIRSIKIAKKCCYEINFKK